MKTILLVALRGFCFLIGIGSHFAVNLEYVYEVFGLNVHVLPLGVAMFGIYTLVILKEFDFIIISSWIANLVLDVAEILLEALVLAPVFVKHGHIINLNQVDGSFWQYVMMTAAGIALLRILIFIFHNTTLK